MAKEWGLLFFGGQMSGNDFGQTLAPSIDSYRKGIYFAGAAVSRRLYRAYSIDIELEGGAGYQYAVRNENDSGQIWGALYFRYDFFPWNHLIYTTVAISTGLNYSFRETAHEKAEDRDDGTYRLQHYLSPEITLAHPDYREWEAVFRLHHRSGVFGLFGCDKCGSNMVTVGVRSRF